MSIEVGAQYRFAFNVKDDTGAYVNPSVKTVTVIQPDGTTATPTVATDSLGNFHSDFTFVQEGLHSFVASTTGPVTYKTDYVHASKFRSVVGITEVKGFINDSDTASDEILRQIMMAATEKAESIVGACVQRTYTNERIMGYNSQVIKLPHAPLASETAVTSISSVFPGGPSWVTTDLVVYPDSGTVELTSQLAFWYGPWKATYTAGRMVVPEGVLLAVKEMIYDLWSIHRSYGSDDLEPTPDQTAQWEQALASYDIPPHAKSLLEPYEMPGFA